MSSFETKKRDRKDKVSGSKSAGPKGIGKASKRPKALTSPIRKDLLSDKVSSKLRAEHDASGPYRHVVIDSLCDPERMRAVHEEAISTMKTTYKETDLFKVYQTGDLANLDMDPSKAQLVPELLALRSSLYSPEFRAFVSRITGVDDLTDRTDCSGNAYTQGCHLLCHDDVIGTRRVSYIIYMTDPDDEWLETDGGSLELYALDKDNRTITKSPVLNNSSMTEIEQGIPACSPSRLIIPRFNRMALFTVQPGRSYHSVQEVYAQNKVRLSISGWYHGPCPPAGADQASLAQVMSKGEPEDAHIPFPTLTAAYYAKQKLEREQEKEKKKAEKTKEKEIGESEFVLSDADRQILSHFINPLYLRASEMNQIKEKFIENSAVELTDFLDSAVVAPVAQYTQEADEQDAFGGQRAPKGYEVGVSREWKHVGPPHKRNHLLYNPDAPTSTSTKKSSKGKTGSALTAAERAGAILHSIRQNLFANEAFARYLTCLTTLKPLGSKCDVRRFRAGLDYTVAHFGAMTELPRLDATLCFANDDKRLTAQEARYAAQNAKMNSQESGDEQDDEEEDDDEDEAQVPDWETGDCGGFEVYISADTNADGETAEAAEIFKPDSYGAGGNEADDESTLLSVSAGFNVLSLVMRDKGLMRFVKYVNSTAPGSRFDITTEYEIVQESDSDEDDDDDVDDDKSDEDENEDEEEK